jgi:sigma-B regulation protein RsbU (phosphoserine phosphatase)
MASLLVLKGTNPNQRFKLDGDLIILGRNPDCQIIIPNHAVSRQHAQISHTGGRFYIEDLQSRNRTYVNNQEVTQRTPLKDNDRIKICDYLFRFDAETGAPEKKPLPPGMLRQPADEDHVEAADTPASIEATMDSRLPQEKFLSAQPAERLRALLEISGTLNNKTLDLETLLPKIADTLFGVFRQADRCFVILRDEASGRLVPKVIKTRRSLGESGMGFSRTIVKQCLETQQALLSEDASSDGKLVLAQSIAEFRIRSVMCVPLLTQDGRALGVIQLDSQDRGKKFTADDLSLLIAVANQAAIALENAQLHLDLLARERMQRDLELAQRVQHGFLPQRLPQVPGYDFYAFYQSALTIGGDYYDFIKLPDGRLTVLLGDVAGKGIPAALLMAKLSAEARFHMMTQPDAAQACTALNQSLSAMLQDQSRFITLAVVVLDPKAHAAMIVKAGHDTPWLFRRESGRFEDLLTRDECGLPLGVMEDFEYTQGTLELAPGDNLLIFTDGVTDALSMDNRRFGDEGVRRAVQEEGNALPLVLYNAPQLGDRVVQAVKQHAAGQSQVDDIALVTLGRSDTASGPSTLSSDTAGKAGPMTAKLQIGG